MDVGDLILTKVNDQSSVVKDHCELLELKTENNNMELKHQTEAKFLEQDTKLEAVQKVVQE
ncbi:hypothetical protein Dimus_028697, partial [Dionaea muscipula]